MNNLGKTMDIRVLNYFLAVAREENITKAAKITTNNPQYFLKYLASNTQANTAVIANAKSADLEFDPIKVPSERIARIPYTTFFFQPFEKIQSIARIGINKP